MELPDGDFVDLALNMDNDGPLVCIFHGLQGDINSAYAAGVIQHLYSNGYQILFMHFRGCSGEPNRLACSYHSGHTDDMRFLLDRIQKKFPAVRYYAVAYSLGANALLKYLGEEKDLTILDKVVAISPPLVLAEGARRMNQGLSRIYQAHLVRQMQSAVIEKQIRYPHLQLPGNVGNLKSFWDFDNDVTAPLNGFVDVHDYYKKASSRQYLQSIKIPTHIIFAKDDPFFTDLCIPENSEMSEHITFELSEHGGHVGFIERGRFGGISYWLDGRITEILAD